MTKHWSASTVLAVGAMVGCFLLAGAVVPASGQSIQATHDPSRIPGLYAVEHSSRPLAEVLLQLQQGFLSPINYEEAPYESSSELRSFSQMTVRGSKTMRVTPAVDFSATLTELDSTPYLALHSIFAQYKEAALHGADDYKIVQQEGYVEILPVQVLTTNGSIRAVSPVMEHTVTFVQSERTAEETLELLVKELTKSSGKTVTLMWDPFMKLDPKVNIGASAELPGVVLAKMGEALGVTLSYQCLYDPSDSAYYVNVYPVAGKVEGNLYNNRAPGEQVPSKANSSSFFTKDLK